MLMSERWCALPDVLSTQTPIVIRFRYIPKAPHKNRARNLCRSPSATVHMHAINKTKSRTNTHDTVMWCLLYSFLCIFWFIIHICKHVSLAGMTNMSPLVQLVGLLLNCS
ncbi:hypothetical protein EUGRSUZ_B00842 [Eucalyptus grandis]|uniref:Uncharacterized protein n=2 Tax=Eucalyptus grandis TaxID=71139 RepID=A0A059D0P5_EUCGR|nr:hypothetical protein EUGRSUZ_B00842 [Eucalyptus grandis]